MKVARPVPRGLVGKVPSLRDGNSLACYPTALMLAKALYDKLPKYPPAPLEDVIDGSVKTGTDLHPVKEWCYEASRAIIEQGKPIPAMLQDRLSLNDEKGQPKLVPETSHGHWFDALIEGIEAHITYVETQRNEIMARTMPPIEVFNAAYQSHELLRVGARFNQIYTSRLPWAKARRKVDRGISIKDALELARKRSTQYLQQESNGDEHITHLILLAAAAHYYSNPAHTGKDESVWQMGLKAIDGTRLDGIAQKMIQALRHLGILSELTQLDNGYIVRYPGARTLEVPRQPIKIVGVWFNYWCFTAANRDLPIPERMQEVDDANEEWAKEIVKRLANTKFKGITLDIRHENGRAIAYTRQGNLFGYVAKEHTTQVPDQITLHFSLVRDGNYLSIYS